MTTSETPAPPALHEISTDLFDAYHRLLVPAIFEPWTQRLLEAVPIQRGDRVLDVACGTGVVTRAAAARTGPDGSVTGLDLLPGMLDVARRTRWTDPPITWLEGNALELPLPDGSFDVVLCQQGLQFFPDRVRAMAEAKRVLRPGGRAAVSVWGPMDASPPVEALQRALERHAPEAAGFFPVIFSLPDPAELGRVIEQAGFADVSVEPVELRVTFRSVDHFVKTYLGATPLGGVITTLADDRRTALADDLARSLAPFVADDAFRFDQRSNIATAVA